MISSAISRIALFIAFYILSLLFLARIAVIYSPNFQPLIIWGGGILSVLIVFIPNINRVKYLPKEYWYYGSLLIFSLLGFFQIIDFTGYYRYLQVLFSNLVLMIVIFYAVNSTIDWLLLIRAIWFSILLIVSLGFFINIGEFGSEFYRFSGLLDNSNGTATYARVGILCSFVLLEFNQKLLNKVIHLSSIALFSYVIVLTASRGNFLNLSFILLSYFLLKNFSGKKAVFISIVFLFAGNLLFYYFVDFLDDFYLFERLTRNESFEQAMEQEARLKLYIDAFYLSLKHPVFGIGLNQFRLYSGGHISHTDFLDVTSQLGLIAGFFYLLIYVRVGKILNRLRKYYKFFKNDIASVLLIVLISELLFGVVNANWFLQLNMMMLSLLITFIYKVSPELSGNTYFKLYVY